MQVKRQPARGRVRVLRAAIAVTLLGAAGLLMPTTAGAADTSTVYYFHGTSTDDANRAQVLAGNAQPSAVFDTTAPTGTSALGSSQTIPFDGNSEQSANALSAYWYGNFSGTVDGALYLDWYWSSVNPEAVALGTSMTVTVYADPNPLVGTTNTKIAQSEVTLTLGATPTLNHTVIPLATSCPCTVAHKLLIQVSSDVFVDTGHGNSVHYDSTAVPSSFHFAALPTPGTIGAGTLGTSQAFANYESPSGFQTRDLAQRQNAGEPSIGADWNTGDVMYMAGTQVSRVHFNTASTPPAATWRDVTPTQLANASEDSILYTDPTVNRTWAEDFLVNPACNANIAYTDNDGGASASDTNTSWTPGECPAIEGPDHPSVGAGPYHGGKPATATYDHAVYYCSQNVLTLAGAECTRSDDGGLTWGPPSHLFGSGTPCGSIHGHIRISPDGTMYVPQESCGGHQGMAVSTDNGSTFTYSVVPDADPGVTDPSVAADRDDILYFGYEDGGTSGHPDSTPRIAVSRDHGATWSPSVDVGAPFGIKNAVFPEVIAGDAGRAAFAFLGTTTDGDYQLENFTGVWNLYVAYTYDFGNTWQVVDATPDNPVQRGCVDNGGATGGAYGGCRNMLDFNDITVDKQGRVYVAYTDGCTTSASYSCDTNPTINDTGCDQTGSAGAGVYSENGSEYSTATCTYGRQSAILRQVCGQGLFAASDPGFSEGPTCNVGSTLPESPFTALLAVAGGGAAFAVLVTRQRRRRRLVAAD